MIDKKILRCPESGQKVKPATKKRITALLKKHSDVEPFDGGFETEDKTFLYPTRDGVTSFLIADRIAIK